jgi:DNA-binding NtrC family response regulator
MSSGRVPIRSVSANAHVIAVAVVNYVRAALDLAGGNRTAAAGLLGLSRQSLYAKLNRYDMGDTPQTASKN